MVHLTKIYTKTGDDGTTALADNTRTSKFSSRIYAIGSVDEANAALGHMGQMDIRLYNIIDRVQNDLFDLGAELAGSTTVKITQGRIDWLEEMIDDLNNDLNPLHSFILPRGPMHLARTIVRRAERDVWLWFATDVESHIKESLSQLPLIYLNRLSDLLFVMSRHYSDGNEKLWSPMNG